MKEKTIALAIPHAPHKPGREDSLCRLGKTLGIDISNPSIVTAPRDAWDAVRIFADHEPHWEWSKKLWRWGLETDADYLLQLQDDVTVPEQLWLALQAMLTHNEPDVIALMGVHPLAREIARMGGRWHRTRAWLLGNGYMLSRRMLREFVPWVEKNEARARTHSEDALINVFCVETSRDVWHPVPSLVDHDTTVASTWGADNHGHRTCTVSWKNFMPAEIADPRFWIHPGAVRYFIESIRPRCWGCQNEDAFITFADTGMQLGPNCCARAVAESCTRMLASPA